MQHRDRTVKYDVDFVEFRHRATRVFYEGFSMRPQFRIVKYVVDSKSAPKGAQNELKNEPWDPSVVKTCKRGSPDPLLSPKMEPGGSKWSPFEAQNRVQNRVDFWS